MTASYQKSVSKITQLGPLFEKIKSWLSEILNKCLCISKLYIKHNHVYVQYNKITAFYVWNDRIISTWHPNGQNHIFVYGKKKTKLYLSEITMIKWHLSMFQRKSSLKIANTRKSISMQHFTITSMSEMSKLHMSVSKRTKSRLSVHRTTLSEMTVTFFCVKNHKVTAVFFGCFFFPEIQKCIRSQNLNIEYVKKTKLNLSLYKMTQNKTKQKQ